MRRAYKTPIYLSIYLCSCPSARACPHLSTYLPTFRPIHLPTCLSSYLALPVCLSIHLPVYLSIYLSICVCACARMWRNCESAVYSSCEQACPWPTALWQQNHKQSQHHTARNLPHGSFTSCFLMPSLCLAAAPPRVHPCPSTYLGHHLVSCIAWRGFFLPVRS